MCAFIDGKVKNMFENKLTNSQAMRIFGLVQILIGIIFLFTVNKYICFVLFGSFLIIGSFFEIFSFSNHCKYTEKVKKEDMTIYQKGLQLIGIVLFFSGLIYLFFNYNNISDSLIPIDAGILFMIEPPNNFKHKTNK